MRAQDPEPRESSLTRPDTDGRNVPTPQWLLPRAGKRRYPRPQTLSPRLLQDSQRSPTGSRIMDRPLLTSTGPRSSTCEPHPSHPASASSDGPAALPAEPRPVGAQGLLAPRPEQLAHHQLPTANGPTGICPAPSSLSECSRTAWILPATGPPRCGSSGRCAG